MLATRMAMPRGSIDAMSGVMVVPDTPPPGECPRAGRPCGRPTAGRLLVHRPIGTAVCYAPNRLHGSRSLSGLFDERHEFCQLKKAAAVQAWQRADAQNGHGWRIGLVGPFPRYGKSAVGSPLEDERFNPLDSSDLENREPFPLERMERMRNLRRSRKGAAMMCSYR
jgi:hypothetical protein